MPLADQMAPVAGLLQELGEQLDTRVQAVGVEPGGGGQEATTRWRHLPTPARCSPSSWGWKPVSRDALGYIL